MKGSSLPHTDNVSRYCSGSVFQNGEVQPGAFMAKDSDPEPSCNWIEFFQPLTPPEAIGEIRKCLQAKGLTMRRTGAFAVINVGESLAATSHLLPTLAFTHEPEEQPHPDPSHSVIKGLPLEGPLAQAIAELLTEQVGESVFPALL